MCLCFPSIPVDTRHCFNVETVVRHRTTSHRRWNNVVCLWGCFLIIHIYCCVILNNNEINSTRPNGLIWDALRNLLPFVYFFKKWIQGRVLFLKKLKPKLKVETFMAETLFIIYNPYSPHSSIVRSSSYGNFFNINHNIRD